MAFSVALFCEISYLAISNSSLDLSSQELDTMKFIILLSGTFSSLFIGWKPTHEGDDLD